jgi:outer membrane biosynthesis protein TonB
LQVDKLIKELIATGTMNEDTLASLGQIQADYAAGTLDPDDEAYVRALHARVTNAPLPEPEPEPAPGAPEALDGLDLAGWRARALKAEAELAALRTEPVTPATPEMPAPATPEQPATLETAQAPEPTEPQAPVTPERPEPMQEQPRPEVAESEMPEQPEAPSAPEVEPARPASNSRPPSSHPAGSTKPADPPPTDPVDKP